MRSRCDALDTRGRKQRDGKVDRQATIYPPEGICRWLAHVQETSTPFSAQWQGKDFLTESLDSASDLVSWGYLRIFVLDNNTIPNTSWFPDLSYSIPFRCTPQLSLCETFLCIFQELHDVTHLLPEVTTQRGGGGERWGGEGEACLMPESSVARCKNAKFLPSHIGYVH